MHWRSMQWSIVKDVVLTGTGAAVILSQVFAPRPSDVLLVTGLALTVPSVAGHASALLSGRGGGESSPSSPPRGSSRGSGGQEGSGD